MRNGEVTTAQVLPIRWSFDERIEDGLGTAGWSTSGVSSRIQSRRSH